MCSLIFGIRKLLPMHVFVCASMCEFQGRNSVKGEKCKTRENFSFFEKG